MLKAYDIILQSEVSADSAAKNGKYGPYRYVCACCGEDVYIAAANSDYIVTHFKHCNGNNNIECEEYLGQYGEDSVGPHSKRNNRERVDFYFEKNSKTFSLGLRFSDDEIHNYEQNNVVLELRSSDIEKTLYSLPINHTYFTPDALTFIPVNQFSFSYFISNNINKAKHRYDFFKSNNTPMFFKLQGNDKDYKAKLVCGKVLYTNVSYFVVIQGKFSLQQKNPFYHELHFEENFCFETMGKKFIGEILTIKKKTTRINLLVSKWDYCLETSETLTLLWPPAVLVNDNLVINSDFAFLYSSFELLPLGNINIHSEDIYKVMELVSKVSVKPKTKVLNKNTEIIINKGDQHLYCFDKISLTQSYTRTYTVPVDDNKYFLFNRSGVKRLNGGQSISLTPQEEIKCYHYGYNTDQIYCHQQKSLTDQLLLNDIISHYRRMEIFDTSNFSSCVLSGTASQYIKKCEAFGLINTVAKQFIEDGRL